MSGARSCSLGTLHSPLYIIMTLRLELVHLDFRSLAWLEFASLMSSVTLASMLASPPSAATLTLYLTRRGKRLDYLLLQWVTGHKVHSPHTQVDLYRDTSQLHRWLRCTSNYRSYSTIFVATVVACVYLSIHLLYAHINTYVLYILVSCYDVLDLIKTTF